MTDPNRKPGGIKWERADLTVLQPTPPRAPRASGPRVCFRCRAGDCPLCVRVGCSHPCAEMRKHGCAASSSGAEHGAPGPGRA